MVVTTFQACALAGTPACVLPVLYDGLPIFHSFQPPLEIIACPEPFPQRTPPKVFLGHTRMMTMTMRNATITKFEKITAILTTATWIFHFSPLAAAYKFQESAGFRTTSTQCVPHRIVTYY